MSDNVKLNRYVLLMQRLSTKVRQKLDPLWASLASLAMLFILGKKE